MAAARCVRVRQFVDDTELRLAGEYRFHIHLFESDAPVFDSPPRDDWQILQTCLGVGAAVCFHEADHDIDALTAECMGVLDHRIGLADAGRGADVNPQTCTFCCLQFRQRLVTSGTRSIRHQRHRNAWFA